MEVLYDYVEYTAPRKGVFRIESNIYDPKQGWLQHEEQHLIIGECDDSYVTRLLKTGHGEWVGDEVIQQEYTLPIGIHKTRFVRWADTQLSLFN